jgi:uroporphyrinogen-III synthase
LCRGPKTALVLQRLGLQPALVAPEPNGPAELLHALDRGFSIAHKRVFVQEYGTINADLLDGLRTRGARVTPVKIYRWALPEDTRDLRGALVGIGQRRIDAAIFTSAHQVENVLEFADRFGLGAALRDSFRNWALVISIGPVTNEALERHGIVADLSPDEPKMALLVTSFERRAAQLTRAKRAAR